MTTRPSISPHLRDIGGFLVRRLLPTRKQRSVGPFVFFDHMGPKRLAPGEALSVVSHPHINLATVTYLFEGAIVHRDSVGSIQTIEPGAINLMVAGRGIAHSERSPAESLMTERSLHGVQLWCALSKADEECEPAFFHHPAPGLPSQNTPEGRFRVLLGSAFGMTSPVLTSLPTLLCELSLVAGGRVQLPATEQERAVYVVSGQVSCEETPLLLHHLYVLIEGEAPVLSARTPSLILLMGGTRLSEPRHMDWNFISTRKERILEAKEQWRSGAFAKVIDETEEFVPLLD